MQEDRPSESFDSFEHFFYERKDKVFRAVLASVGDFFEAEDCTAEAFARALTQWTKVSELQSPSAWVTRTATNFYIDRHRRSQRHLKLLPELARDEHYSLPEIGMDPSMLAAIRRLPERQREVIAFRILLGLSSSETAHELELSVGAVGTHLHRALNTLRIALGDNNEEIAK